jgi:hypothetical protein
LLNFVRYNKPTGGMAKKVLLEVHSEPTYYTLIGISCHLKDYRLTHLLNKKLESDFIREADLPAILPGMKEPSAFPYFSWKDEDNFNSFSLIANRNGDHVLVTEIKMTDFILLVEGEFRKNRKDAMIRSISSIPNVLTAYEIKFATIKNFENLLTDIEIHKMNIQSGSRVKYEPGPKKERSNQHV